MKKSNKFQVINLNKDIQNTPIINDSTPNQWVAWGKKNDYPTLLLDLYAGSTVHRACCDFLATCILGDGIDWNEMKLNGTESTPNFNDSWESFLYKIALDYIIFGGFAFQIIKNNDNKTFTYFHQPFTTIRLAKMDDEGDIKHAYLCKDWSKPSINKPQSIEVINFTDDNKIAKGKSYLFYFADYNIFDPYYPQPHYSSALNAIQADAKLQNYDLNAIVNNFTPSGILTLNPVSSDEERELILKNINSTFSGDENANNLIITFKKNSEDLPASFAPIQSNSEGVNLFSDTNNRTIDRILSAHRITSKGLIGMPLDSAGFSDQGGLLQVAYNLLEKTHIQHMRNKIFSYINNLFKMNGINTQIVIKPFSFNLDVNTAQNHTSNANVIDDDNIAYEEKINA